MENGKGKGKVYTDNTILFSWVVSFLAIIRISTSHVYMEDTDGTIRTFDGGSDTHEISISVSGSGKKQRKSIIIKKKLPICDITYLPIYPGKGIIFKSAYALNKHVIQFSQHKKYNLQPVYYYRLFTSDYYNCYLVVKIDEGIEMDNDKHNKLAGFVGLYIADLIKKEYKNLSKGQYFTMIPNNIDIKKTYHKSALLKLFNDGILEIGIKAHFQGDILEYDYKYDNIVLLNTESWNHIFPNGNKSHLQTIFTPLHI